MNGNFTLIKKDLIKANIKNSEFRILCYLISCSKNGKCYPSIRTLAKKLNKSKTTIMNGINNLENNDFIKRKNRTIGTGKKTSNEYIINKKYLSNKTKQEIYETTQEEIQKEEMFDYDWLNEED